MKPELVIPVIFMMDSFVGPLADLPYNISTLIEGQISLNRIQSHLSCSRSLPTGDVSSTTSAKAGAGHPMQEAEEEPLLIDSQTGARGGNQKLSEAAEMMLQYDFLHDSCVALVDEQLPALLLRMWRYYLRLF